MGLARVKHFNTSRKKKGRLFILNTNSADMPTLTRPYKEPKSPGGRFSNVPNLIG